MRQQEIELRQEDIAEAIAIDKANKGYQGISTYCPIQQALHRTFPEIQGLGVAYTEVLVRGQLIGTLSANVEIATRMFSANWPKLQPFTFTFYPAEKGC